MPSTAKYPFAAIPAPALLAAALLVLAPTSPACSADNPAAEGAGQVEQSATHPAAAKPADTNPVLTLDDLVGIALEHNKGIEAARQRVAQSDGELTQARAAYLPRVEVAGTYSYVHRKDVTSLLTEDGGVVAPTATESEEVVNDDVAHASAEVSQLLYDFGRTGGAIAAERSNREAAEAALGKQRNATIFQVKKEYYNVLEKMRLVEVAGDSVASFAQHLERTRKYLQAGVRTRVDVINAEVEHANARMNLSRAGYNLQIARTALDQVLGTRPNQGRYRLADKPVESGSLPATLPTVDENVDALIERAVQARPDLRRLDHLIDAAQAGLEKARGDYFPSITANARYNDYDTGLSLYQDNMEAGVTATWELFSGFRTAGAAAAAQGRVLEHRAQLQDLRLLIAREVTESWLRTAEARESVAIARQTLELARENLVLAEKRYETGAYDVLEFNEAQRTLTKTRNDLVVSYYGYLTSLAALDYAIGS